MKIKYVIFSALGMLALNAGAADNALQIKNLRYECTERCFV